MEKIENGTYIVFEQLVPSMNLSFVMKNLRHFAAYNIEVQACRAQEMNDTYKKCSTKSMRTYRTLPLESADNIPPNTFKMSISGENNSLTMVTLQWDEPPQPNGLIITYQIEYKRVDIQNVSGIHVYLTSIGSSSQTLFTVSGFNNFRVSILQQFCEQRIILFQYKPTVVCITRRDFTKAGNSYVLKELPAGNYSVKVRATSLAGYGAYTHVKYFYIEERNTLSTFWVIFWLLLCVFIAAFGFVSFYFCKRKFLRNVPNVTLIATVNPEYVSTPYVLDEWEVPREKIEMLKSLGTGTFGMVYEGIAKDIVKGKPEVRCAVKTVNKDATDRERIEFLNEASVMK